MGLVFAISQTLTNLSRTFEGARRRARAASLPRFMRRKYLLIRVCFGLYLARLLKTTNPRHVLERKRQAGATSDLSISADDDLADFLRELAENPQRWNRISISFSGTSRADFHFRLELIAFASDLMSKRIRIRGDKIMLFGSTITQPDSDDER